MVNKNNSRFGKTEDWRKLLISAGKPSTELEKLKDSGKLASHPELMALIGCLQDSTWHPEGMRGHIRCFASIRLPLSD